MDKPKFISVRARDVKPHLWALWCSVEGFPEPFANTIEAIQWSEDEEHLWFCLGTHNFYKVAPNDMLHLIAVPRSKYISDDIWEKWNAWRLPPKKPIDVPFDPFEGAL